MVTNFCFRDGIYRTTVNLLRKYLGDFLIASYLDVLQDSGYDDSYIKEIEVRFLPDVFCATLNSFIQTNIKLQAYLKL